MVTKPKVFTLVYNDNWGEYILRRGSNYLGLFCEGEWERNTGFKLKPGQKAQVTIHVRRVRK